MAGLTSIGLGGPLAIVAGFAVYFVIRALALHYRWSLPVYRARPGRMTE